MRIAWLGWTEQAMPLVHHTTKKIPAEVFALEKQHLRPVPNKIKTPEYEYNKDRAKGQYHLV